MDDSTKSEPVNLKTDVEKYARETAIVLRAKIEQGIPIADHNPPLVEGFVRRTAQDVATLFHGHEDRTLLARKMLRPTCVASTT